MAEVARDEVLQLIEQIYEAATAPEKWTSVLSETTRLLGGSGTVLEIINAPHGHVFFQSHGVPVEKFDEYSAHIVSIAPRVHHGLRQPVGRVVYDYQFITEQEMSRDESYDFFSRHNGRYFVGGILQRERQKLGIVSVMRSTNQGHADRGEVELMELLLPHYRSALEMSLRWQEVESQNRAIHDALNCLCDGVLILRRDATVLYASEKAQDMARQADGFSIHDNTVLLDAEPSRAAFYTALEGLTQPHEDVRQQAPPLNIPVHRPSGAPPYIFTLKPVSMQAHGIQPSGLPQFILFIHDSLQPATHDWRLVKDYYGLTPAELDLAEALHSGVTLPDYTKQKKLSKNTVYTHYRHLKDKMKCQSQLALIKKLADLAPPPA